MSALRTLVGGGVAFVVAFGATVGLRVATRPSPPRVLPEVPAFPVPTSTAREPACPDIAALRAEVQALEEATTALELQVADERVATAAIEGTPIDWPDDIDPAFQDVGVEAAMQDAFDTLGAGELLALDCSEYPCVAIAQFTSTEDVDAIEVGNQLGDALGEAYKTLGNAAVDEVDGVTVYSLIRAVVPVDLPTEGERWEAMRHRLQFRYRDLTDAALHAPSPTEVP